MKRILVRYNLFFHFFFIKKKIMFLHIDTKEHRNLRDFECMHWLIHVGPFDWYPLEHISSYSQYQGSLPSGGDYVPSSVSGIEPLGWFSLFVFVTEVLSCLLLPNAKLHDQVGDISGSHGTIHGFPETWRKLWQDHMVMKRVRGDILLISSLLFIGFY